MKIREKSFRRRVACAALTLSGLWAGAAVAQTTVITGFDYSMGDYGEADSTDMLYLPLTLKYRRFPWTAKMTLPWISITGPASVTAGTGGVLVDGADGNGRRTDSGIGDVSLSLGFALDTLWQDSGDTVVDLTGRVKLPTADPDARLGTGETDYQLQIDIARVMGDTTPFITLGYRWMGDTPNTDYNDVAFFSIGIDRSLKAKTGIGLSLDFTQATRAGVSDRREAMAYLNQKISERFSVNLYGVVGFSDASPDQAIGTQFVFK